MNHYVIIILLLATIILLSLGYADTAIRWGALCLLISAKIVGTYLGMLVCEYISDKLHRRF